VTSLSDDALRTLIREDPAAGWRAFIDQYTPLLVGLIRRAGLDDRDEVMEVYVVVCERLSAQNFARLKTQDAQRGSIGGWLAVMTRHAAVDWIRSKKGRRRLFQAVRDLSPLDQRVFELFYWDDRTPSEICEIERTPLAAVLESLERIQCALSDRHRGELLALAVRSKPAIALDETDAADHIADPRMDPETAARTAQVTERFEAAIRSLPAEDAAIVRLKYVEGLSNAGIEKAIGVSVTASRMHDILTRLRSTLRTLGIDEGDAALLGGATAS
jgi:DNA-directed RNA polymerase specialized sigma24 family protein